MDAKPRIVIEWLLGEKTVLTVPRNAAGFSVVPQLPSTFAPSAGDPVRAATSAASSSRVRTRPSSAVPTLTEYLEVSQNRFGAAEQLFFRRGES